MREAEFVICHLRSQVHDLQGLLNYLESLDAVQADDYHFIRAKLHDVIRHLKQTARLSLERSEATKAYDAHWLN